MPALPADIQRATRRARIVTREDSAVLAAFPAARDALDEPDPGYFENAADAVAALEVKAQLVGAFRRRLTVSLAQEYTLDPAKGIPTFEISGSQDGISGAFVLTRAELDLETETSTLEVFG